MVLIVSAARCPVHHNIGILEALNLGYPSQAGILATFQGCRSVQDGLERQAVWLTSLLRRTRATDSGKGARFATLKCKGLIAAMPQVLKKVMQHEIAESFFNEPVDPDALGIPEYREIVQVRKSAGIPPHQGLALNH